MSHATHVIKSLGTVSLDSLNLSDTVPSDFDTKWLEWHLPRDSPNDTIPSDLTRSTQGTLYQVTGYQVTWVTQYQVTYQVTLYQVTWHCYSTALRKWVVSHIWKMSRVAHLNESSDTAPRDLPSDTVPSDLTLLLNCFKKMSRVAHLKNESCRTFEWVTWHCTKWLVTWHSTKWLDSLNWISLNCIAQSLSRSALNWVSLSTVAQLNAAQLYRYTECCATGLRVD